MNNDTIQPSFIYNITTKVNHQVHEPWLQWMQNIHIPQIMQTQCFIKYQLVRLLETDDTEGPTYALQLYAESKAQYNRYVAIHAPELRDDSQKRWGTNTIGFRSLMEVVH